MAIKAPVSQCLDPVSQCLDPGCHVWVIADSGLTSGSAVRLTSMIEERLGEADNASAQRLPATLVFDYPSVAAIVEFLESEGYGAGTGAGAGSGTISRNPGLRSGTAGAAGGTGRLAILAGRSIAGDRPTIQYDASRSRASVLHRIRSAVRSVSGSGSDLAGESVLDDDAPLLASGLLNSAGAVRLTAELEAAFRIGEGEGGRGTPLGQQRRLPPTLAFDQPSIAAIADYLLEEGYVSEESFRGVAAFAGAAVSSFVPQTSPIPRPTPRSISDALRHQPTALVITAACHVMPGDDSGVTGSRGFSKPVSSLVNSVHRRVLDSATVPPLSRCD